RRRDRDDGLGGGELQLAHGKLNARPGLTRFGACVLKFLHSFGGAIAAEPHPYRRQRSAPDLARSDREIAVDQEWLERTEQQPRRIVGARSIGFVLVGAAHGLPQHFQHEGRNRGVLAPLQRALELPHQQRLRLRRQLCEVFPQTLDRCLVHAGGDVLKRTAGASTAYHKSPGVKNSFRNAARACTQDSKYSVPAAAYMPGSSSSARRPPVGASPNVRPPP